MKSSILKGTLIYTMANTIIKLGGLVFLPIMTRILTTEEFGIIGILSPITTIFTIVLGLGFYNVILKKYVDLKSNKKELERFKFTVVFFVFCLNVVVFLILLLPISRRCIEKILNIDYILILLSIVIAMVNSLNNIALSLFRIERKYYKVAVGSLISFFTNYILAIYFISKLGLGIRGSQFANLFAVVTLFIFLYVEYFKDISPNFSNKYLVYSIYNGIPLIFIELTDQLVNFSDRYILARYNIAFSLIGAYTLAYTGSRILAIITGSFINAWTAELYENIYDERINRNLELFFSILAFFCIGASLFSKEAISLLFPAHYLKAIQYMPIVLTSTIVQSLYSLDYYFHYFEKSKYIVLFTFMALVINVVLNIIFIPLFIDNAVLIAGLTTLIALSVRAIIEFYIIKKYFKISFRYKKFILYFLLAFNPLIFYISRMKLSILAISVKILYILICIIILIKDDKNWKQHLQYLRQRIIGRKS